MKLTPKEAKEQGYNYFVHEGGDDTGHIDELIEGSYPYSGEKLILLSKNLFAFRIDKDTIMNALSDCLDEQEDVYDEDGVLHDELVKADFEAIEKLVNVGFTERWRAPTDIELDMSRYNQEGGEV